MAERAHNQKEYQNRSNAFKGSDEHGSKDRDYGCLRNNKTKNQADDQSTDDTLDQADVVPLFN